MTSFPCYLLDISQSLHFVLSHASFVANILQQIMSMRISLERHIVHILILVEFVCRILVELDSFSFTWCIFISMLFALYFVIVAFHTISCNFNRKHVAADKEHVHFFGNECCAYINISWIWMRDISRFKCIFSCAATLFLCHLLDVLQLFPFVPFHLLFVKIL